MAAYETAFGRGDKKRSTQIGQKVKKELRELRQKVTFAVYAQEEDLDKVTGIVDELLNLLSKTENTR